jgi:hypothetical protein
MAPTALLRCAPRRREALPERPAEPEARCRRAKYVEKCETDDHDSRRQQRGRTMVKFGILATLEVKIGKEHEIAAFLRSALPLV